MTQPHPEGASPGPASSPRPAVPSDGADPASNEAGDPQSGEAGDYTDALKQIEGEPRPQG